MAWLGGNDEAGLRVEMPEANGSDGYSGLPVFLQLVFVTDSLHKPHTISPEQTLNYLTAD